jgi:hypothetical protein
MVRPHCILRADGSLAAIRTRSDVLDLCRSLVGPLPSMRRMSATCFSGLTAPVVPAHPSQLTRKVCRYAFIAEAHVGSGSVYMCAASYSSFP